MGACIPIEVEAVKLYITVDTIHRLVSTGLIDIVEWDGGCLLTVEGESKAQLVLNLNLLRTRKATSHRLPEYLQTRHGHIDLRTFAGFEADAN